MLRLRSHTSLEVKIVLSASSIWSGFLKHRYKAGYAEGSLYTENLLDPFSRFDTIPRRVTADGQTAIHSTYRAMHVRCVRVAR